MFLERSYEERSKATKDVEALQREVKILSLFCLNSSESVWVSRSVPYYL